MTEYYDNIIELVSSVNEDIYESIERNKDKCESVKYIHDNMYLSWVEFSTDGISWGITCLGLPVVNSEEFYFDDEEPGHSLTDLRDIIMTFFDNIYKTIGYFVESK